MSHSQPLRRIHLADLDTAPAPDAGLTVYVEPGGGFVAAARAAGIETPPCSSPAEAMRLVTVATQMLEASERGAARLDALIPGWASAVDAARLNMERLDGCPLTALFGSYRRGLQVLGVVGGGEAGAEALGFTVASATFERVHAHSAWLWTWLTQAWRSHVVERRVVQRFAA